MYGDVGLEVDHSLFEEALQVMKERKGVSLDTDLAAADLEKLVAEYKKVVQDQLGRPFPQDPREQLQGAIGAVFGSWMTARAVTYRRLHGIPESWGTAVHVQATVFGRSEARRVGEGGVR